MTEFLTFRCRQAAIAATCVAFNLRHPAPARLRRRFATACQLLPRATCTNPSWHRTRGRRLRLDFDIVDFSNTNVPVSTKRGQLHPARGSRSEEHRQAACADRPSTNIDCSTFDLDAPAGEITTNGHRQSLAHFLRKVGKRILGEAIVSYTTGGASIDLVGSPDAVAAQMSEATDKVGGDGFLFSMPNVTDARRRTSRTTWHQRCGSAA